MGAEERLGNEPRSELWGEHRSRYRWAGRWASGRRVLDVACGVGFGLELLVRSGAGGVVGVDLDLATLQEARGSAPRAGVLAADGAKLPFADHAFDLVVSFETIEHVPDAGALVAELRRVLRPGGRLVLSTPNRAFGPPERHTANPFHVREFTAHELEDLLKTVFAEVTVHGQYPLPAYRYVPFLLVTPHYEPAALVWKAWNRLPFGLKDGLARALTGRAFYPEETSYRFVEQRVAGAHALLAIAR